MKSLKASAIRGFWRYRLVPTLFTVGLHGGLIFFVITGFLAPTEPQVPKVTPPSFVKATVITADQALAPARKKEQERLDALKKKQQAEKQRKEKARQEKLKKQREKERKAKEQRRKEKLKQEKLRKEKLEKDKQRKEKLRKEKERKEKEKKAQEQQRKEQERQKAEQARREAEERNRREAKEQLAAEQAFADALASEEGYQQAQTDAELAQSYAALITQAVEQRWSRPASARKGMTVLLLIRLIPTGEVVNVSVLTSSGNEAFDRSAILAVKKAERFPELQQLPSRVFERDFRRLKILFNPKDLRL